MSDQGSDPTVRQLRHEISQVDRAILAVVNARLELVARLKEHKDRNGLPFVDPDRERQLIAELEAVNHGPLSAEGVRELYTALLGLTKREVSRDGNAPDA
jgi:chorismate mutase/prephenate dehydratase